MSKTTLQSIGYGLGASLTLLGIYFLALTLVSGWSFARNQFDTYWIFIISLAIGFGFQIALFTALKHLAHSAQGMGKVAGVTGTVSTAAMVSCCAHYLVNLLPILGATGLVTFVAQYQVKLFWVGILLNLAGIAMMASRILKLKTVTT